LGADIYVESRLVLKPLEAFVFMAHTPHFLLEFQAERLILILLLNVGCGKFLDVGTLSLALISSHNSNCEFRTYQNMKNIL